MAPGKIQRASGEIHQHIKGSPLFFGWPKSKKNAAQYKGGAY